MECSICNECYDETEHKPFLLNPCGHCFCLKCIKALTKRECPECRGRIKSEIPNYAVLKFKDTTRRRLSSALPLSPSREAKIFKSLEYTLNEMDELKQSLADTLKKKQTECRSLIEDMRGKIQKETESKITRILSDNQKLISQLDLLYTKVDAKLNDLSQTEKTETDLERFEKDLNSLSLSELSKNETKIKCDVKHRIRDLENFKLNVVVDIREYDEDNQVGRLIDQELKNSNQSYGLNQIKIFRSNKSQAATSLLNECSIKKDIEMEEAKFYTNSDSNSVLNSLPSNSTFAKSTKNKIIPDNPDKQNFRL